MKTYADFGIEVPAGSAGEIQTTCPECSSQRKKKTARCLSVNTDKAVWCCHHCGWSGSINDGGRQSPLLHWQKPAYRRPDPMPATDLPGKVVEWFASRGIPETVLKRNQIGYGQVYMPQLEAHVNAIRFPYYRGDGLVNIKHRDGKKHFRLEVGAERCLYGVNDLGETTVIVEGEIDKLSLEAAGITACVSVPDGAPPPASRDYASKFSFLDADDLSGVREWIIATDSDEPGQRLEDELARRLGRDRCRRVRWPDGCKDSNDVLVKHGAAVLADCIEHAEPYPLKGVFSVRDLTSKVRHLYEHGWERGVSTGWSSVDSLYTVRAGEFTVITGIPGAGKSNWLDHLLVNLALLHGWGFAVFSPENQPIEDHLARLAEKWTNMPFGNGPTERMSIRELDAALEDLNAHFHFILDNEDDAQWTLDFILERAASLVFRHGIRGLIIDPWNEIEHQRPREITETEYVSITLKRIRTFARQKGLHVWVVAHPAKLYREKDGDYPVPSLYDISGSAHWRNKCDNGITIWRESGFDRNSEVDIHIQKIRFKQVGKTGMVSLKFDKVTHTYRDINDTKGMDYEKSKYGE